MATKKIVIGFTEKELHALHSCCLEVMSGYDSFEASFPTPAARRVANRAYQKICERLR